MKCPKCQNSPIPPREYFKLAHGAGPVMVQCGECYASLTWMNRKPLAASAGLASLAVAVVLGVTGELFAEQLDVFIRVAVILIGSVLTYAALSYRAWSLVVVRPSTLSDLQSVPDAAAREMRTEETLFSYVYVAIIMLAIGLTMVGAGSTKLYEHILAETDINDTVYFAIAGGTICLLIGFLIFRFRRRMADATIENLRRKEIAWKAVYASMGPDMVIQRFQKRRKRLKPLALTPILLGMAAIALTMVFHGFEQTKWADEEVIGVISGFLLFGCGIIFLGVSFRCPVCSEPPWASVPGAGRGMTLDPISCPTCGSPLKKEGLFKPEIPSENTDDVMLDDFEAPVIGTTTVDDVKIEAPAAAEKTIPLPAKADAKATGTAAQKTTVPGAASVRPVQNQVPPKPAAAKSAVPPSAAPNGAEPKSATAPMPAKKAPGTNLAPKAPQTTPVDNEKKAGSPDKGGNGGSINPQ